MIAFSRISTWAFRVALVGFLAASVALAVRNQSPGSVDSCGNLTLARNLAQGRGYVTTSVGQLWVPQTIPAEDTVKPPALPFLLAAIFRVTGESLAVPVLVNALAVLGSALLLRLAVTRLTTAWLGDLAGLLILISYDYEMVSIWNNNFLALGYSALLYLATRRGSALPIALAVVTILGFLMKPTFVLGALPFSILILGLAVDRSVKKRLVDVLGFLAVSLVLTSPYWGRNLVVHGALLYSPSFTSSRLALRYGVLGDFAWQTVRFDRPMTYREVVARVGWSGLVLSDVKELVKTLFYTVCLNPGVAVLASALLLFARPARWPDYAGPGLLIGGILFEVGVYNHHEFRYLWPIYPCLITLAALGFRDFEGWGVAQMSPALAARSRWVYALLAAVALLVGVSGAAMTWRQSFQGASRPPPGWIASVRSLPADALILTPEVAAVSWWTDRSALIAPVGLRSDLDALIARYPFTHVLAPGNAGPPLPGLALGLDELTLIDQGEGWRLYRHQGKKP